MGEVNDVDTGQGQECKNESETMIYLDWPRDKMHAIWLELKNGIVSYGREKRRGQDIEGVEEI